MVNTNATAKPKAQRIREPLGDRVFSTIVIIALVVVNLIMLYPFLYVISTSISSPAAVVRGEVFLLPKGFNLGAYMQTLTYPFFLRSYLNTVIYTVVGTILSLFLLVITGYPLSIESFTSRKPFMFLFVLTMFFSGGMIPTFLIVKGVGLYDNWLAMVIPGALSAWNLVICKNFFESIPSSLHESAYLDGASDWTILWRIIVPLSKPVIATLALFCIVANWNAFFSGLVYLNNRSLYPLQLVMRNILMNAEMTARDPSMVYDEASAVNSTLSLKTASVMITILPVLCVYPFIQKYFVKGVMIGSVKG